VSKSGAVSGSLLYEFAKFNNVCAYIYICVCVCVILIVVLTVSALAHMYRDICKYVIHKYIYIYKTNYLLEAEYLRS